MVFKKLGIWPPWPLIIVTIVQKAFLLSMVRTEDSTLQLGPWQSPANQPSDSVLANGQESKATRNIENLAMNTS